MRKLILLFLASIVMLSFQPRQKVVIAAAADLRFAMDSIAAVFRNEHPDMEVQVVYGASGQLYEQIVRDAPFDIFFSADAMYPAQLLRQHKTLGQAKIYGSGRLVLWSRLVDPGLNKMNTLLDPRIRTVAIANPQHAPYGKRAMESLQYYKLNEKIKDKLVMGENIAQTAQYLTTGAADIGLVALSLALSPGMQHQGGRYWIIPDQSHRPLEQAYIMLVHAKGNAAAGDFAAFFNSTRSAAILSHFGFSEN